MIEVGSDVISVRAAFATGVERNRLYAQHAASMPQFLEYAKNTTRMIPVVVLTSSREEIQIVESYQLGVNSYVVKPTDSKKFAQIIGDVGYYWLTVNQRPQR